MYWILESQHHLHVWSDVVSGNGNSQEGRYQKYNSQMSVRARISNFLNITKWMIVSDLLWTDIKVLIAKLIFWSIEVPGFIWMSYFSSIERVRTRLWDLVICIWQCEGGKVSTLLELLDITLETACQMWSGI